MFRPCIDLHEGRVKQIVGTTLTDNPRALKTNFISNKNARWYAELYKKDALTGGHIILLGPGNIDAACEALQAYPGGLQLGGGIQPNNALFYLDKGASHVIVTSWIFKKSVFSWERVLALKKKVGKSRLVLDLSCRKKEGLYVVVTNRWQTFTDTVLSQHLLEKISLYCDEILIHAADVEGKCAGMDWELIERLNAWGSCPITYAGGARSLEDLKKIHEVTQGKIHLSIGSALDIFGGSGIRYKDAVAFNKRHL
jgi:phosphoribosylformimino-5-aminoimidazole carboxamide ribotide isomerase